jgi:hypothetical protein
MKRFKRWIAMTAVAAMLVSSTDVQAQGFGYMDGTNAASISPELAFAGLLALSIAVVALQNANAGTSHTSHGH